MARKKKGRGSKRATPTVTNDRLDALLSRLDDLRMDDCSDDEFEALAQHLARSDGDDSLASLARLKPLVGERKARSKALKRLAHKLKQRGVDISSIELAEPRSTIRIAAESVPGGGLPVLLAPLGINGERRFSFALRRGPAVVAVEGVFKARELFRLMAQPSNRDAYRQWANQLCRPTDDGSPPERVRVPPEWLERKFWEIGRFQDSGDVGREVDHALLEMLSIPRAEPTHPAFTIDIDGRRRLSLAELAERPERLYVFYHGSAMAALRQQWYEFGGNELLDPGAELAVELRSKMQAAVADWTKQWGLDRICEATLDLAMFCESIGDLDAAATFIDVVTATNADQRRDQIRAFLYDYVIAQLTR